MSIFDDATIETESPAVGQEEVETAEAETQEDEQHEEEIQEEAGEEAQESSPEEEGQEEEETTQNDFDYVKAYGELRKAYTQKSQELAAIKKQPQLPAQGQEAPQERDMGEVFWESFQRDPIGTLEYLTEIKLQQRMAPIVQERQNSELGANLSELASQYTEVNTEDGVNKLFAKVQEIAVEEYGRPELAQHPTKRLLKLAAQEAFGETKARIYSQAKQKGREEALNTIKTKQGLSVNTGVKPKKTTRTVEDEIADSIVNAGRRNGIFG